MKKPILFTLLVLYCSAARSQTLGGYPIIDFLVTAVHPNNCSPNYVTGLPDDSTWVNFMNGDIMTGTFGASSVDTAGFDLLLETSYHPDNYNVRLILTNNQFSAVHNVQQPDWTQITDTTWVHLFANCFVSMFGVTRYVLPLDYDAHFGLGSTDTVTGIEITFLTTPGAPDLAGVYRTRGTSCYDNFFPDDTTLCAGTALTLDATTTGATYLWQDNSTGNMYTVTQPGLYWVQVTKGNCVITDTIQVNYAPIPQVQLGNDTSFCPGSSLLLNATTANASYLWQNNTTGATLTASQPGLYWVTVTVNQCSGSDSINLSLLPSPTVNLGPDTAICAGSVLMLDATTANAGYLWSTGATAASINVSQAGPYWVQVTVNQCSARDTITLSTKPLPQVNLGADTMICAGQQVTLSAATPNATYRWQDNSNSASYTASQAGWYSVEVTVNGCSATDSLYLSLTLLPVVDLGPDTTLCEGYLLLLDATTANATYLWQDNSGASTFQVRNGGTYWVRVDVAGCLGSDTIAVETKRCNFFIPDVFTPNGDGLNDVFSVYGTSGVAILNLSIYNRWGNRVVFREQAPFVWDGTFEGKTCDVGTYFYLLTYRLQGSGEKKYAKGSVTLIR